MLLPGLINAHCHLDFTDFKGRVPYQGSFRKWSVKMAKKTRETSPAEFRQAIHKGIRQSLAYGTTTLCDVATSWESYGLLRKSGLRAFVFLEMLDLPQASAERYWRNFLDRLWSVTREAPSTPTFRWGLSPHTGFTVSRELLETVGKYVGKKRDILTTIHVSESREEDLFFRKGEGPMAARFREAHPEWKVPTRTTAVQYFKDRGWMPKLDLAVHVNVADDRDIRLLAKNRIAVVHCPGSHAFFGHPRFKYGRMRQAGIPVCLGTDSLASNRSLSLFREMKLFKREFPGVPPQEILRMTTVKPAQALGMGNELGQIRPGFLADIIGIPAPRKIPAGEGFYDRVLNYRGTVSFVMVHGEPRLRLSS